jgi:drug/metabolite transporter (DMT)-like permease
MQSRLGIYALLALMPLLFSTNVVIGRGSVALVEPWTLAFWRWGLAAAVLLPFAWAGIARHGAAFRAAWIEILILALLGMFICGGLVYVSLHWTSATNAALLYTGSALFIVVLDALYFRQPLSVSRIAGLVIGFLGVTTIVLQGEPHRFFSLEFNKGDLGIAVCAFSWAVYTVMLKAEKLRALPTLPLFAVIAAVGALTLAPPMLYEAIALNAVPVTPRAWLNILMLAVIPSVGAYGVYQICVKEVGPSITGVFMYFMPVYSAALAALTLGESFLIYHVVGLVLVLGGVALASETIGARKPR